jgi:hypothetical protein
MRTTTWLWALCLSAATANAQVFWETDGNTGIHPVNNYVGTNENDPLNFRTDSIFRMRLWNTTNSSINTFLTKQNGFLGISDEPAFFSNSVGPFSRIHLVDSLNSNAANPTTYLQQLGFRPWMRNGIAMTGNSDQCYMGAKYNGNDSSDIVLQWSDNPDDQIYGTDRLRFLFTTRYNAALQYGARSREGLESFRIFVPNDTSANVGIGDWWRATVQNGGVAVDPTERLDVLTGRVRIRQLPEDSAAVDSFYVMVVDRTLGGERGVVKWVDPLDLPPVGGTGGGAACDWNVHSVGNYNVRTAYGAPAGTCPSRNSNVGIGIGTGTGTTYPQAKLHVLDISGNENGNDVAVYAVTQAGAGSAVAGSFLCTGGTSATGTSRQAGSFSCSGGLKPLQGLSKRTLHRRRGVACCRDLSFRSASTNSTIRYIHSTHEERSTL